MSLCDELETEIYSVINHGKMFNNDLDTAVPLYASELRQDIKDGKCPEYIFNSMSFVTWYLKQCQLLHIPVAKPIDTELQTPMSVPCQLNESTSVTIESKDVATSPYNSQNGYNHDHFDPVSLIKIVGSGFLEFVNDFIEENIPSIESSKVNPFKYGHDVYTMISNKGGVCKQPITVDGTIINYQQ